MKCGLWREEGSNCITGFWPMSSTAQRRQGQLMKPAVDFRSGAQEWSVLGEQGGVSPEGVAWREEKPQGGI